MVADPKRTPKAMFTGVFAVLAVIFVGTVLIASCSAGLLWSLAVLGIVAIPVTASTIGAVVVFVSLFFGLIAGLKAL